LAFFVPSPPPPPPQTCFQHLNRMWMLPGAAGIGTDPKPPTAPTARYTIVAAAALVAASFVVRSKTKMTEQHAAKIASFMFNDALITPACDTWAKVLDQVLKVVLEGGSQYVHYKTLVAPPPEAKLDGTIVFREDAQSTWAAQSPQSSLQVVGPRSKIFFPKGADLGITYIGTKHKPSDWDAIVHDHANPSRGLYGITIVEDGEEKILDAWSHRFGAPNAGQIDAQTAYDPSANVKVCPKTLKVIATQPIRGGEKLLMQYGDDYWPNINHTVFIRKQSVYYKGKQCSVMKTDPELIDQHIKLLETAEDGQKTITHKAPVREVTFRKPEASKKRRVENAEGDTPSVKRANTVHTDESEDDSEDDVPLSLTMAGKYSKKVAENKALSAEIEGLKRALAEKEKEMEKLKAVLRAQDE
jgi:hypothetical protein